VESTTSTNEFVGGTDNLYLYRIVFKRPTPATARKTNVNRLVPTHSSWIKTNAEALHSCTLVTGD
jgi:hypothetical protein